MPTTTSPPALPGADLGWTLGVILRSWHARMEATAADLPHGTRGFQILAAVAHATPRNQAALAQHLNIDKTVMPYVVDALVADGLVVRVTDPSDRRARLIQPTEHGLRVLAGLEAQVASAERDVLGALPEDERAAFVVAATRAAAALHADGPSADPCFTILDAVTAPRAGGPR